MPTLRLALACTLASAVALTAVPTQAQPRHPTARETAAIRDCAATTRDDIDAGERRCVFKLVADPCTAAARNDGAEADCFRTEAAIWDALLNDNYTRLIGELDEAQIAKAKAMQRAWIAYRDTTCGFYDDKIQGTLSNRLHAACETRETARRALLLDFFGRL